MKVAGRVLLVLGFLWIAWDCFNGFSQMQHARWIAETKQLPPGDWVSREEASAAMRDLALSMKDYHRMLLVPAMMMLVGGVLITAEGRHDPNQ